MMELRFSVLFITVVAAGFAVYLMSTGVHKNKGWLVALAILPLIGAAVYAQSEQERERDLDRMAYAQTAFTSLYRPDYFHMEKVGKDPEADRFQIETENGVYQVSFRGKDIHAFHVDQESGESLRARKNVFDVLSMTGLLEEGASVLYEETERYILFQGDEEFAITLEDDTVVSIVNGEGEMVHQAGEPADVPDERPGQVERSVDGGQ